MSKAVLYDLPVEMLKVSGETDSKKLANALVESFKNGKSQEMRAVGAASVNCAVKAAATARQELMRGPSGLADLYLVPAWFDAQTDSLPVSGILLKVVHVKEFVDEE